MSGGPYPERLATLRGLVVAAHPDRLATTEAGDLYVIATELSGIADELAHEIRALAERGEGRCRFCGTTQSVCSELQREPGPYGNVCCQICTVDHTVDSTNETGDE